MTDSKPWHQQFWPWFLISLPATAVIAGLYTVFLAVQQPPDIVRDKIITDGKSVNMYQEELQRAKALGVAFQYNFEANARQLRLTPINGVDAEQTPLLNVSLQHPTLKARDIDAIAARMPDGGYALMLAESPSGRYRMQIGTPTGGWLINGEIIFNGESFDGKVQAL
ncbi:Hypothetical protein HDN1F_11940 [gamma proteobacterium HdN1]|nr:Hypothetical protein HDN1F_11940 [gamma proteobacterium HdN1]